MEAMNLRHLHVVTDVGRGVCGQQLYAPEHLGRDTITNVNCTACIKWFQQVNGITVHYGNDKSLACGAKPLGRVVTVEHSDVTCAHCRRTGKYKQRFYESTVEELIEAGRNHTRKKSKKSAPNP